MAEWSCRGWQILVRRFDSGSRLQTPRTAHGQEATFLPGSQPNTKRTFARTNSTPATRSLTDRGPNVYTSRSSEAGGRSGGIFLSPVAAVGHTRSAHERLPHPNRRWLANAAAWPFRLTPPRIARASGTSLQSPMPWQRWERGKQDQLDADRHGLVTQRPSATPALFTS
jgi:hypothetical protein